MIRSALARRLRSRLLRTSRPLDERSLHRPALVIAPHPDDETLGCGGLVARKRQLGVPVTVVFMTDGAASHPRIERAELVDRRRNEALDACAVLGVESDHIHFLDIADGTLEASIGEAIDKLQPIVDAADVDQLVVPHPDEPPPDHAAAHRAAVQCGRRRERPVEALLYPVWLWDQWPFTNPFSAPRARTTPSRIARTAIDHRLGVSFGRALGTRLDVSTVLDLKRRALACHRSQVSRPPGDDDWPILADVARGEWLDQLLGPHEFYRSAELAPALRPVVAHGSGPPDQRAVRPPNP